MAMFVLAEAGDVVARADRACRCTSCFVNCSPATHLPCQSAGHRDARAAGEGRLSGQMPVSMTPTTTPAPACGPPSCDHRPPAASRPRKSGAVVVSGWASRSFVEGDDARVLGELRRLRGGQLGGDAVVRDGVVVDLGRADLGRARASCLRGQVLLPASRRRRARGRASCPAAGAWPGTRPCSRRSWRPGRRRT